MENPFGRVRQGSVARDIRQGSVARDSRQGSVARDVRQGSISREASVIPRLSTVEIQTKEAVKQTVIAALRLHSISPSDTDYKGLISHTVTASMFALRGKLKSGKVVGMGEIGSVVEGLLDIFLK